MISIAFSKLTSLLFAPAPGRFDTPRRRRSALPTLRGSIFLLLLTIFFLTGANSQTFTYTVPWDMSCCQDMNVNAVAIDPAGNIYLAGSTRSPAFPATPGAFQTQSLKDADCFNPAGIHLMYTACYNAFVMKLAPTGVIVYATLLGGNGNDIAYALAVDSQGSAYVSGSTAPNRNGEPNSFPLTPGAAFPNPAAAFVAKLNPDGSQLAFSSFLPLNPQVPQGAVSRPTGLAMALDTSGNVYVTCASGSFTATPGAFQTVPLNSEGAGVIKLNAAGSAVVYATYLSASPYFSNQNYFDVPLSIAVDPQGDAFVAGFTPAPGFPITPGAYQTTFPSQEYAGFLTKLNPQGTGLVYSTFLGAAGDSGPWTVRVDRQGGAWVLGQGNFPDAGVLQSVPNSSMLVHLSPDGSSMTYSTYLPQANALDLDSLGNVYVAGCLGSAAGGCPGAPNIPTSAASFQPSYIGNGDGYAARFDAAGALTGATYLGGWQNPQPIGGADNDSANLVAVAPNGSVVIAGTTFSPFFPGINPAPSPYFGVGYVIDMFTDRTVRIHKAEPW